MKVTTDRVTQVTPRRRLPPALRSLLRSPTGSIGLALVALFVLAALFAPQLAPYDPNATNLRARQVPPAWVAGGSAENLLGTDQLGRDILSRLIFGTRVALIVGLGGVPSPLWWA